MLTGFVGVSTRDLIQDAAPEESPSALAAGEGAACSSFGTGVGTGGGGGGGTTCTSHAHVFQTQTSLAPRDARPPSVVCHAAVENPGWQQRQPPCTIFENL